MYICLPNHTQGKSIYIFIIVIMVDTDKEINNYDGEEE